jgi:hypothetical protein
MGNIVILIILIILIVIVIIIPIVLLIITKSNNNICDNFSTGHGFDNNGNIPTIKHSKKIKNQPFRSFIPFLDKNDDLPRKNKLLPGSFNFKKYSSPYNALNYRKTPDRIYFPKHANEIVNLVQQIVRGIEINKQNNNKFYWTNILKIVVKGGGHSYTNLSSCEGCQNVYLNKMTKTTLNYAQGGARLIHVYETLKKYGRTFPGGTCATVGLAGLSLGGGYGFLSRAYGFSCENINSADIITYDPTKSKYCLQHIGKKSQQDKKELFNMLMGAGHNTFGIVTKFYINTVPLPPLTVYFTSFCKNKYNNKKDFIKYWTFIHNNLIKLSESNNNIFDCISFAFKIWPTRSNNIIQIQGQCIQHSEENAKKLINLLVNYITADYFNDIEFHPFTDYEKILELWDGGPAYSFPSGQINKFYETHPTFNHMSILIESKKIDFGLLWDYLLSEDSIQKAKQITGKNSWNMILAIDVYPRKKLGSSDSIFKKFTSSYGILGQVQYMNYLPSNKNTGSNIDNCDNAELIKKKIDYQTNIWENSIVNNMGKYQYSNYPSLYSPNTYFPNQIVEKIKKLKKTFDPLNIFI